MKVFVPGTSSGVPEPDRYHTSFIFYGKNETVLIDCGASTVRSLQQCNINVNDINVILVTHFHADHVAGLPSLIVSMKLQSRQKPLNIFLHKSLVHKVWKILELFYLNKDVLGFEFNVIGFDSDAEFVLSRDIVANPYNNTHIIKSIAPDEVSSSFIFSFENKKLGYTADIGNSDDLKVFNGYKLDYCITELSHITFDDVFQFCEKEKPGKTFLTHYHTNRAEFIKNKIAENNAENKFVLLSDWDELTI